MPAKYKKKESIREIQSAEKGYNVKRRQKSTLPPGNSSQLLPGVSRVFLCRTGNTRQHQEQGR
jgi:hypothetical protein